MPECLKCGWVWISRKKHPKNCPRCKSLKWNKATVPVIHGDNLNPVLTSPSKDFIQIGDIEKQRRDNPAILQ